MLNKISVNSFSDFACSLFSNFVSGIIGFYIKSRSANHFCGGAQSLGKVCRQIAFSFSTTGHVKTKSSRDVSEHRLEYLEQKICWVGIV